MNDEPQSDQDKSPSKDNEQPEIYSVSHENSQPSFSRRSFLEMAAVAAGAVAVEGLAGCRTAGRANRPVRSSPPRAHDSAVSALAINAQGTLLASGDLGGVIKLWQLPAGALIQTWNETVGAVTDLAFAGGDSELWSAHPKGILKRWQMPSGGEKNVPGGLGNLSAPIAFPGTGDWLVAVRDGKLSAVYSQATGESLRNLGGFEHEVTALKVTPDGRMLLAGGDRGSVGLWNAIDGTLIKARDADFETISALALAADGSLALRAGGNGHLQILRLPEMGAVQDIMSTQGVPHAAAIRPQLDVVAVGSEQPKVLLWQVNNAGSKTRLLTGHGAAVRAVAITPDGGLLFTGSDDKTIRVWSLPGGKHLKNLVDLSVNYKGVKGASVKGADVYGRSIVYTLPCGSPIPPGAICTCNCVPGSLVMPNNYNQNFNRYGYCTCDTICTCNTICTCQSVGQGGGGGGGGGGYYVSYWYPN